MSDNEIFYLCVMIVVVTFIICVHRENMERIRGGDEQAPSTEREEQEEEEVVASGEG